MSREDNLLKVLEIEWQDHFQTRLQTWKALELEAALLIGLIGIDWQLENPVATALAALILMLAAVFGVCITIHHRKVEIDKFKHIIRIEEELKLDDVFGDVKVPKPITFKSIFSLKTSTPLFLLRAHATIFLFGAIYLVFRLLTA